MKNRKSKEDILLEARIKSLYNSFQHFIGFTYMPKLEIKLVSLEDRMESILRITFSNIKMLPDGTALLETLRENPKIMGDGLDAHYYHEFTHIYDNVKIKSDFGLDEGSYTKLYTEFHAEQVSLKKALGFSAENENKKVSLSDNIKIIAQFDNVSKPLSFGDYIMHLTNKLKSNITECVKMYEEEKNTDKNGAMLGLFRTLLNSSLYYFATADFARKYCVESIDEIDNLLDINMYDDYLGKRLQETYVILSKGAYTKDSFLLLFDMLNHIMQDFTIYANKA